MIKENIRRDLSYKEECLYEQLTGLLNMKLFDDECLLCIKVLDDLIDEILKHEETYFKDLYKEGKLEALLTKYKIKDLEELEKALKSYRLLKELLEL